VLVTGALLAACSGGTSQGATAGTCGQGETYCSGRNGGGFCASACPEFACPVADAGSTDSASADGAVCPAATPLYCTDCNGGGFCVNGGCPATSCPARDASPLAATSSCPAPVPGTRCSGVGDACEYDEGSVRGVCTCTSEGWHCYTSCPASMPSGGCNNGKFLKQFGLTCSYPNGSGAVATCTCAYGSTGATNAYTWNCGADVAAGAYGDAGNCPAAPATSGQACRPPAIAAVECVYPNGTLQAPTTCYCNGAWDCNSAACPATYPAAANTLACGQLGLSCGYSGGRTHCTCTAEDAGAPTFSCNPTAAQLCGCEAGLCTGPGVVNPSCDIVCMQNLGAACTGCGLHCDSSGQLVCNPCG